MNALTIHEAAETTGWSPRMLRYVERAGLVTPARSTSGYRLYGPAELQRLRTLKELLVEFEVGLSDVAFAARMARSAELREAVQGWLEAQPRRPEHVLRVAADVDEAGLREQAEEHADACGVGRRLEDERAVVLMFPPQLG